MNTDVLLIEKTNAMEIYLKPKGLDPLLDKIKEEINMFVPDISTAKGRKEIASMANKVAKSKTHLDRVGKELVADLKARPKLIDEERKRIRNILDKWKQEVRAPLTEWETLEESRVQGHKMTIGQLNSFTEKANEAVSAKEVEKLMGEFDILAADVGPMLEEFEDEAKSVVREVTVNLKERKHILLEAEKLAAIEEAERVAKEKEAQRAREEQIRIEAQEKAKKEAQEEADRVAMESRLKELELEKQKAAAEKAANEAIESAKKAQEKADEEIRLANLALEEQKKFDKLEAQRLAKEAKEEADRVEREKREAEEVRKADLDHRRTINNEILEKLTRLGFDNDTGKLIIMAAAQNNLGSMVINY